MKFIVRDVDSVYTTPRVKEYIDDGGFKKDVPFLKKVVIMKGVVHFIMEEKSKQITTRIHHFITKFQV